MKLKYYLRGAGIGVIVTTLIFTIALAFEGPTTSEEDIIREAEKLGMVSQESLDKKTSSTDDNKKNDQTDDKAENKEDSGKQENATEEMISFHIDRGDSSAVVSKRLQEMNLVDNAESFDSFLSEQNFDNLLQPGEYQIPKDSSFLEIAKILTTKKE